MARVKRTNPLVKIDEDPIIICRPDFVRVILPHVVADISRQDGTVKTYRREELSR